MLAAASYPQGTMANVGCDGNLTTAAANLTRQILGFGIFTHSHGLPLDMQQPMA